MSNKAVKFLNEKCLLRASIMARREIMEDDNAMRVEGYEDHLHAKLGQMLGAQIMRGKAETALDRDPRTGDYVRHAEVYVLSPEEMRRVYNLMRDELRDEIRDELRKGCS